MKSIFIILGIILVLGGFFVVFKNFQKKSELSQSENSLVFSQPRKEEKGGQEDASPKQITFLAGGDVSLSRYVAYQSERKNDPTFPFQNLEELLLSTDFNFANLETPFSKETDEYAIVDSVEFNAPEKMVEGLKKYNFQIVNLANNHAFDQGLSGLLFTREWLSKNGIKHIGAGENLEVAHTPEIVEVNGVRVLFFGFSYASENDGGIKRNDNVARMEDLEKTFPEGFREWEERLDADYTVITMHAGKEYTREPDELQKKFARKAVDLGADIVIGAHPHWIQPLEEYRGKYIFYSLGNFVFDQDWSQETKEGLLLKIQLEKNQNASEARLSQIELLPIVIINNATPRLATDEESQRILASAGVQKAILVPGQ